jgi:hypothetical protein
MPGWQSAKQLSAETRLYHLPELLLLLLLLL